MRIGITPEKNVRNKFDTTQKYKAMQWKRKSNAEHTSAYHYLEHPDKKIKSEVEALESWVARAADKILRL